MPNLLTLATEHLLQDHSVARIRRRDGIHPPGCRQVVPDYFPVTRPKDFIVIPVRPDPCKDALVLGKQAAEPIQEPYLAGSDGAEQRRPRG